MKNETIVDRVVDRLKKQPLGDLIQEEDLHDIIKEAVPKAFFENRYVIDTSSYNSKKIEKEPVIVEALRDALESTVREWVKTWTIENGEVVAEYWKKVMDEKLLAYVQRIQDERATADVRAALNTMISEINRIRSQNGQNMLYL